MWDSFSLTKPHGARLLTEMFKYVTSPGSVDRLRRINGEARFSVPNASLTSELLDDV